MNLNRSNLILIGMPGCGKTTIGKEAAKHMHMKFIDLDKLIEKREGKSINEIFIKGETYFRSLESDIIAELCNVKDTVISTGGGVVKKACNMELLNDIGFIVFINRNVDSILKDIDTESRPLLNNKSDALYKLYNERIELYKGYCHAELENDGTLEQILTEIISIYKGSVKL